KINKVSSQNDSYNSFQYWRTPLPELDLSLLEDPSDGSQTKDKAKVKDPSSSSYTSVVKEIGSVHSSVLQTVVWCNFCCL
uniref:Putative WW-binding domain-containing protein n=1 Tax=Dicentrarchus labrax TaxID=13489 RepID=A0A8P4FVX6_DICLA